MQFHLQNVLESIDNACGTSFLFIEELHSMLAVLYTQQLKYTVLIEL